MIATLPPETSVATPRRAAAPGAVAAALSAEPAVPPRTVRSYADANLPGIVGYGLFALFAFDLAQIAGNYQPFQPGSDANLVTQLVERVAVPLVAYLLVFLREKANLPRFERTVRKLLSIGALAAAVGYLGLAALAVSSGLKLHQQAENELQRQVQERTTLLKLVQGQVPAMEGASLQVALNELVRRPQALPPTDQLAPAEMRRQIVAAIPVLIDATNAASARGSAEFGRRQFRISAKYALGGLVSALLFFLIWEATHQARAWRIFSRRSEPQPRWEARLVRYVNSIRLIPDLDEYHWHRRFKNELRLWREKREARAAHALAHRP